MQKNQTVCLDSSVNTRLPELENTNEYKSHSHNASRVVILTGRVVAYIDKIDIIIHEKQYGRK